MKTKAAYDKEYLPAAQKSLGAILDVAANCLHLSLPSFYESFLGSPISSGFEKGDPFVVWGKSGTEIAFEVAGNDIGKYKNSLEKKGLTLHRSPEYWAGWSLAYYQWKSAKTFEEINRRIGIESVKNLYNPYHEMDILQFCDRMDEAFAKNAPAYCRSNGKSNS